MIRPDLIGKLRSCRDVVVFTGAEVSAESGIPTFRDRFEGMWSLFDLNDVATPAAFRHHPQTVWDWHVYLASKMREAEPNPAHRAIAELETRVPSVKVITQNIDGLHQQAGSQSVMELHGNLFRLKAFFDPEEIPDPNVSQVICPACDAYAVHDHCDPYVTREDLADITLQAGPVPTCPCCGALLRPDIVWFGEPLDIDVLDAAMRAADTCDLMICIGSSLEVQPAASIPFRAKWAKAVVIEINPEPTQLSFEVDVIVQGKAAETLPPLIEHVWGG